MKSLIISVCAIFLMSQSIFSIAPAWTCNSSSYLQAMTFTGVIQVLNVESTDANDMVGAFVGSVCRGVANPIYIQALNRYIVFMTVYSNVSSGEDVTFKIYRASQDNILTLSQTKKFVAGTAEGEVDIPYIWSYTTPNTKANIQTFSFSKQSNPAVIDSTNNTVVIKVDYGTSLNTLTAGFTLSAGATAKIGSTTQVSNTTVNNFTNPLVYIVTAEDNINVKNWTIYVSVTPFVQYYDILIQKNDGGIIKENNVSLMNNSVLTVVGGNANTFTITPNTGYEVATLTYNGADVKSQIANNQYTTALVNANATLNLTFKKILYRLSIKDADNGYIDLFCEYGTTPSFDFLPKTEWKVNTVHFNDVDVTSSLLNGMYTVPAITANAVLNVSFNSSIVSGAPENIDNKIKVYAKQSEIIIDGTTEGETITLFSANGKQIQSFKSEGQRMHIQVEKDNMYLLKTPYKSFKVIL